MALKNVVLEIGTEKIPYRFIPDALAALKQGAASALTGSRIGFKDVNAYATPRRLVMIASEVEEQQQALKESFRGPPLASAYDDEGNPTRAALGFAKSKGVSVDDLKEETVKGVRYVTAEVCEEGRATLSVLPDLLRGLIEGLTFPKSMYWNDPGVRFARPIRWILALADDQVVPFSFAGVESGRMTSGHRFMGKKAIEVKDAADFMGALFENKVILDQDRRRQEMLAAVTKLENQFEGNLKAELPPELVEENLYLVEYPVPFVGSFDARYLEIPEEVLVTSMKKNQKYFPVRNADNKKLANFFIGVSNNRAENMQVVREGNERVLRARLEDAAFFWKEDLKRSLSSYVDRLKDVTYQEKLGSMKEKVERTQKLALWLCGELKRQDLAPLVERAAWLSKADQGTSMVFEFPELQGVMGREYALRSGEDPRVAKAIFEHYLPRSASDALPTDDVGAILGVAERLHIITACYKVGLEPTSAQDPYALRRAARGMNEILWARNLDLDVDAAVDEACRINEVDGDTRLRIGAFLSERLKGQLYERGYDKDLAVLAISVIGRMPNQALRLMEVLTEVREQEWFVNLVSAAVRVRNILQKAGREVQRGERLEADPSLMTVQAERELDAAVSNLEPSVRIALESHDWQALMELLAKLSPVVTTFFDDVMVMDRDEAVRNNRLMILERCGALFSEVGDIGSIKLAPAEEPAPKE